MAEYIEIASGSRVSGTLRASGAKNAALPVLISTLLTGDECHITNVPNLEDVNLTLHLLEHFGASVSYFGSELRVSTPKLVATEASYSLVKALRASFWVLGPLLARGRAARVALPGGDIIGARPVDLHLEALTKMGAEIRVKHGVVFATAVNGLRPAEIDLRFPSVGATHQIIMAAALTPGTTVLRGAAKEPEVVALADFISSMGCEIEGAGNSTIIIRGTEELSGTKVDLIGDRIEAGTYLLAAAASGGSLRVEGINYKFLESFLEVLAEMNVSLEIGTDFIALDARQPLRAAKVKTGPFPAFPTDLQAPLMAALAVAEGESRVEENVFEGRFGHVSELCRMGAAISVEGRKAIIKGVDKLTGAPVEALDIRAGAALVIAAVAAREGVTEIYEIQHLRRGYASLEERLAAIGVKLACRVDNLEDYAFTGC